MITRIILLSITLTSGVIWAFGFSPNSPYKNAALESAYQAIQKKVLNLSTREVVQRAGTETDVTQCFQEEFLTDPVTDAPITPQRKMQRSMKLIRAVLKAQTVSGLTLEATDFHETVALDFHHKEESLEAEKAGLWASKVGWGSVTLLGVGGIVLATQMDKRSSSYMIVGGVACGVTLVGGGKFYSTLGKEGKLTTHIGQIQTMKNSWEESFKP